MYVQTPDKYYRNSVQYTGTPGWQFAPVPGWGINPLISARYPRVATNGLGADPGFNLNTVLGQQQALNYVMAAGLTEDGTWGPSTKAAAIAFQKQYGLQADGGIGTQTIAKLQQVISSMSTSPIPDVVPSPTPSTAATVPPGGTGPGGTAPVTPAASSSNTTTYLIIGGVAVAAVAAYFLMKK